MENKLLQPTKILDYRNQKVAALIEKRGWNRLNQFERAKAAYDFVRDEIEFGYNRSDDLTASEVLQDGYGQCNTKATLLMAILRALSIPCRLHGFTIDKKLQKGAVTGLFYFLSPKNIIHSWVEVELDGKWINLEGFILDKKYLESLQRKFSATDQPFCGFGVATKNFAAPQIEFNGGDTYIQKEGINQDFGVFDSPDEFYSKVGTNLNGFKKIIYENLVRYIMIRNVERIRSSAFGNN